MALPMPETKNGDHFYKPNYPPKPRKKTPLQHVLATRKWYFGHITYFAYFGPVFKV